MSRWQEILTSSRQRYEEELLDLLRIPSVSAADAHIADVLRAADWVSARLEAAGMENVAILPTGVHACVYGDWLHAPGKPTILLYGHFDVQPPDPLELWDSPPFEPVIKDGCVFARGATDMKGNLILCVAAVEALLAAEGALPVNVKFLFEGQEEIGSRDLAPFVAANRERLSCDLVLTPDGAQWGMDQPAMWMSTRGLCALQVDVETAALDLHSGQYGGAVPNAAHALVQLLHTLHDADGRVLVGGFYDEVVELSAEERNAIDEVPFDAEAYRQSIGLTNDALIGEPGYTTYERAWVRPTLEINGIWGGYQGDGVKTVIPAKAHAKLTCRLVAAQEPTEVLASIEAHIERYRPPGTRINVIRFAGMARAYALPADHPGAQAVAEVLTAAYGTAPHYVRAGGTLPIMDMFLRELNAYTIDVGFGLEDERAHSPNEFFRLANFARGQILYGSLLERLGSLEV